MSIHGISPSEYELFLEQGGTITVTIDEDDLNLTNDRKLEFGDKLYSGFQDPPPAELVNDIVKRIQIYFYGKPWERLCWFVYGNGGKITIYKVNDGYKAEISLPNIIDRKLFYEINKYHITHDGRNPTKVYFTKKEENELILSPLCQIEKSPRESIKKLYGLEIIWMQQFLRLNSNKKYLAQTKYNFHLHINESLKLYNLRTEG